MNMNVENETSINDSDEGPLTPKQVKALGQALFTHRKNSLDGRYKAMARDQAREAAAMEWTNALAKDMATHR